MSWCLYDLLFHFYCWVNGNFNDILMLLIFCLFLSLIPFNLLLLFMFTFRSVLSLRPLTLDATDRIISNNFNFNVLVGIIGSKYHFLAVDWILLALGMDEKLVLLFLTIWTTIVQIFQDLYRPNTYVKMWFLFFVCLI